ncbi:MAG: DUF883 family protein [Rubrivivax sp.]|nr:MAG: DUF883 family protein [Rubrivivax sp.]
MSELTTAQKDKLFADLKEVLIDAEALLRATAHDASAGVAELRAKAQANLARAKDGLVEAQGVVADKAKVAAKATDEYVHDNPWQAVGVAVGVGLLLGLLIGRR